MANTRVRALYSCNTREKGEIMLLGFVYSPYLLHVSSAVYEQSTGMSSVCLQRPIFNKERPPIGRSPLGITKRVRQTSVTQHARPLGVTPYSVNRVKKSAQSDSNNLLGGSGGHQQVTRRYSSYSWLVTKTSQCDCLVDFVTFFQHTPIRIL